MLSSTISVVITCYSEGDLIFDAVKSVDRQSLQPVEIILVNDASTDRETIAVCRKLEQNPRIRIIWRSTNGGPSAARNDGFRAARGEVLVPLDADDVLPENALEHIQRAFTAFPKAGFVYGNYLRQNQPGQSRMIAPGDISLRQMLRAKPCSLSSQWALIGTTPLRRSLWESLGGYDPDFSIEDLHDVEFWIRVIASGCHYCYVPEVIYIWRKYLGSNSRQVTPLSWYRIAKKHFDVYCQVGLKYRAYELLLLGSKWLKNADEVKLYSQQLSRYIRQGNLHFSSSVALALPGLLLRLLVSQVAQNR